MRLHRPDPLRLDPRAYPLQAPTPTEPNGITRDQHVSNIALAALYDGHRNTLLHRIYTREVREDGLRPLLVEATLAYRAEVFHPATVTVATAAGRIGRSSFGMLQALFVGADCVGLCDSTFVNVGRSGPEPIAAAQRALLAELAWGGLAGAPA